MKKDNSKFYKISLIAMTLSLVFFAIVTTYSWYTLNSKLSIGSDDNVNIRGGVGVEIALVDNFDQTTKNYGSRVSIVNSMSNVIDLPDITGNGLSFYYPKSLDDADKASNPKYFYKVDHNSEDKDDYFITLNFCIRSSQQLSLYLSNNSFVSPKTDLRSGTNVFNKSMYGSFTKDYIAGAVRVAFIEQIRTEVNGEVTYTPVLKCIWAPNDRYELKYSDMNNATFNETGAQETTYEYLTIGHDDALDKDIVVENKFETLEFATGEFLVGTNTLSTAGTETTNPKVNNEYPIVSFDKDAGLQEKYMTVVIWVEGTDREADKALNGGEISVGLELLSISKSDTETPTLYLNNVTRKVGYLDENNEFQFRNDLEYTTDGFNWKSYGNGSIQIDSTTYQKYYFRVKETETAKPGYPMPISEIITPE